MDESMTVKAKTESVPRKRWHAAIAIDAKTGATRGTVGWYGTDEIPESLVALFKQGSAQPGQGAEK